MTDPITTQNLLSGLEIMQCWQQENIGDQSRKHYIKIPCENEIEAKNVAWFIAHIRDKGKLP